MPERVIQLWIEEERARCAGLVKALDGERGFLLYCIDNAVGADEIEQHRQRFAEFPSDADDIEGLM